MNDIYITEISKLLASVKQLTGVNVLWKTRTGGKGDESLPEEQYLHCNPFCKKVKKSQSLLKKCSFNDCSVVMKKCEKQQAPFINKCHAGVIELIIPLFKDDIYEGSLFFGPFKKNKTTCICKSALKEYAMLQTYNKEFLNSAGNILSTLSRYIFENKERFRRKELSQKIKNKKLQTALEFINKNFTKNISVTDAAGACRLSESRFIHLFKHECGIGFSEFLTGLRIDEAKKLLAETDMKIYAIASLCGYSGQCYFGLVFRNQTGMSPLQYRRKYRKRLEP